MAEDRVTAALQRFAAAHARSLVAYAIVAVLWITASILIADFGAYADLRYIVELAAVICLVGIGQTIAGGGIDLSVSAIITVTAIILPLVSFDADATGLGRSRSRLSSPQESEQ
jgi:ribose transport system permease protein